MAKTYANGVRDATLNDISDDVKTLTGKFDAFVEKIETRCRGEARRTSYVKALLIAGYSLIVPAIGFLYVALIRGWF